MGRVLGGFPPVSKVILTSLKERKVFENEWIWKTWQLPVTSFSTRVLSFLMRSSCSLSNCLLRLASWATDLSVPSLAFCKQFSRLMNVSSTRFMASAVFCSRRSTSANTLSSACNSFHPQQPKQDQKPLHRFPSAILFISDTIIEDL